MTRLRYFFAFFFLNVINLWKSILVTLVRYKLLLAFSVGWYCSTQHHLLTIGLIRSIFNSVSSMRVISRRLHVTANFSTSRVLLPLMLWITSIGKCSMIEKQSQLSVKLMETYDSKIRPAVLYNHTVNVKFKLYLNQILDVVCAVRFYRGDEQFFTETDGE